MSNPQFKAEIMYSGIPGRDPFPISSTQWESYYSILGWLETQLTASKFGFKKLAANGIARIGLARARNNGRDHGYGEFITVAIPDLELVIHYRPDPGYSTDYPPEDN